MSHNKLKMAQEDTAKLAEAARENPMYQAELMQTLVNAYAGSHVMFGENECEKRFVSST
jgi:hypothetical protein